MVTKNARKRAVTRRRRPFPIVGIGASAGGLEAFTQLLQHFPANAGMALVLVQHLDPAHASELARLLARVTPMPVHEVTNNLRVEPDRVYVIPPGANLAIVGGVLRLAPRVKSDRPQHAIDAFFESLAQDQRERAIGVVLSGTGADGTMGLEMIKAEGGITLAQDESAKYNSMPRSAVAAGCVDFVLAPDKMAKELARIAKNPYVVGSASDIAARKASDEAMPTAARDRTSAIAHQGDSTALPSGGLGRSGQGRRARGDEDRGAPGSQGDGFKKILLLLRNKSGVDFSLYKSTTIQRRIARRMTLGKYDTFADYASFLRGNEKELDTLFSDVLISVTSFFRNPDAFDVLKRVVFAKLLKQRRRDDAMRVWVLGCSTGQEAYSVGMTFLESAEKVPRAPKLQIFATDLNESLLEKARAGLYPKSIEGELSAERLRRFFVEEEGGYRIIKPLREAVVFARQNLISDPPFSRMDLVCCRNLLIYLEPALQGKLLPTFHYALKPDGFLFLGASESVGAFTDLFEPVKRKLKIFSKKAAPAPTAHLPTALPRPAQKTPHAVALPPALPGGVRSELSAEREADRLVVNEIAPPGVIVNAQLQIVQFRGATANYLTAPSGKASFDVLKMAREGLMLPLRAAINKAKKENQPVRRDSVRMERDGRDCLVDIQVVPLKNVKERSYLVLFQEVTRRTTEGETGGGQQRVRGAQDSRRAVAVSSTSVAAERADVRTLRRRLAHAQRELAETRDYLQAIQEQHDAANEELQASSEEAQSANEELQSINEEMETSKEELESTNEELTTVNEEMASRNAELRQLNADLNNLHASIHTAILVLGRDLTIRRFTALAEKSFNLRSADLGRPLGSVRPALFTATGVSPATTGGKLGPELNLGAMVREVIDTVSVCEREVQDSDGHWYSLRVRPYMTADDRIDGAVLALLDIDTLKRSEREADAARKFAETVIRLVRDPLIVLDDALRVRVANEAFYRTFEVSPRDTEGRLIYELGDGHWNIAALRKLLEDILPRNNAFNDFEVTHSFPGLGRRTMLLNARRLASGTDALDRILLGVEDITGHQRELRQAGERFRLLAETVPEKIFTAEPNGERDYFNQQWLEYAGLPVEQLRGWGWTQLVHPDDLAENRRVWKRCVATGEPYYFEQRFRRFDGQYRSHISRAVALKNSDGKVLMWVGSNTDVHDIKESDRRKDEFLALLAHELRNPLSALSNAVHIVRHGGDGPQVEKAIGVMERQARQMAQLVDELLDVSRISRGRIKLHRQRFDVASMLNHAVDAAQPLLESREQQLTRRLPPQPVYVDADPTRFAQIVGNLLGNASKFSERRGAIRLEVATEDTQVVIRVKDTGIGIPEDQLEHIFDAFMQVDTSRERSQGGLGLGLTLAKRLVDMHGGTIEAHSAGLGLGSEFVVRLPMSIEPSPPSASEPTNSRRAVIPAARRVLVADDNPDAASTLAMLLEASGHEVHTAHDGIEAVEAAARLKPDVIILDVGMPGLDGYEAARRIRKQRSDNELVLIALTGWGQEDDKRRSKKAGFDFHLVKPVDVSALQELLESVPTAK